MGKKVLVAWDDTYFSRLWCTFELAAYRRANRQGRIQLLPISVGSFTFWLMLANLLLDKTVYIVGLYKTDVSNKLIKMNVSNELIFYVVNSNKLIFYVANT